MTAWKMYVKREPRGPAATLVCFCLLISSAISADFSNCREPLGMQSGAIPDSAITASSYHHETVGPQAARIRTEVKGGAWCPKRLVAPHIKEWLQIDLGKLKVITQVETQGRFGNGQGQEYAEKYYIMYLRQEGGDWRTFRNRRGHDILTGNKNTYTPEPQDIDPPIIARKIRIIPTSDILRTVCMRVEIHGCDWKDGVVSYDIPQGDSRGSDVDLYDFTYDGTIIENHLTKGLGQLTDGELGDTNFRLDRNGRSYKGYEWVGWKNDTRSRPPVELEFHFDTVRNFSSIKIHSNNMFSKDVRVFKMAKVYFSIGGKLYQKDPVVFQFMQDPVMEYARNVDIKIPNIVGQHVRVHLYFSARWIMISEVTFDSKVAVGNFTGETPVPPGGRTLSTPSDVDVVGDTFSNGKSRGPENGVVSDNSEDPVLTGPLPNGSASQPRGFDDQLIGIIVGVLGALILLLVAVVLGVIVRNKHKKSGSNSQLKSLTSEHVTLDLNDIRTLANGKLSNGNMYNSVATSDSEREEGDHSYKNLNLQDQQATLSDTNTSREYAVPDVTKSALIVNTPMQGDYPPTSIYRSQAPSVPPPPYPTALYATSDIGDIPNIQGTSGNSVYAAPNIELLWKDEISVMEFPRERLKFVEKLGEGQFGEVHLCEAGDMSEIIGDDFLVNRTGSTTMLVALKMLRAGVEHRAREDFYKEVKIMSRLKDPNIVRVLGVCTQEEPLCVIVEYMKFGDLNQYLQQHVPESTVARKKRQKSLSYGSLIYMATQVASGMKYLETLNMVHRDLASRNCLVGYQFTIKISDFGMSRSLYSSDYYRIEGRAMLPIRWMSWESILLGKFSSRSDVWSFGVTLWEILNFCREQPFDGMTDEQVIENSGHYYRNDGLELYLPQPSNCPKEIYDLIKECWNREEAHRPTFREIHMFLQRKNMGYNPREEKNYGALGMV